MCRDTCRAFCGSANRAVDFELFNRRPVNVIEQCAIICRGGVAYGDFFAVAVERALELVVGGVADMEVNAADVVRELEL